MKEHVSEYGTHWNFFFTLAILPLLVTLQKATFPKVNDLIVGGFVGLVYQFVLVYGGLEYYIINAERVDLISMNREGLCSLIGKLINLSRIL